MHILGINAYHGNASAALVSDGRLIAAVEEERFNRVKYAAGFPSAAIRYCLDAAGITLSEVDHVAIPRNPWARLGTKLMYALKMPSFARERAKVLSRFVAIPEALAQALDVAPDKIRAQFHRVEHHQAHLASAFFVSPFAQAALRRWPGRLRQHHVGSRSRKPHEHCGSDCFSSFPGDVLHRSISVSRVSQ